MAFVQRLIDVAFTLASGTFAESGTNQVTLSGLRISAKVQKAGGLAMSTATLDIYGMTLSLMNRLSTLGLRINQLAKNTVTVKAGDAVNGMAIIFIGTIYNAYADFQAAPEVPFRLEAHTLAYEALQMGAPCSYPGVTSVANIMASLATLMNLPFENNGVTTVLTDCYLAGTLRQQAQAVVDAANIKWNGGDNGVLAIWPKTGSRGGAIPLISAETGMVSYPTYTTVGVLIKTIFNPSVGFGGQVEVKSSLEPANGVWTVLTVNHTLETMMPNGQWFSELGCYSPNQPTPITQ